MTSIYIPAKNEYLIYNKEFIINPEECNNIILKYIGDPDIDLKRGKATYIDYAGISLVLKHYYRGGIVAKFNKDTYLWTGLANTRVFKEWRLLEKMKVINLPVPTPIAAKVERHIYYYRADLITQRIPDATSLGDLLVTREIEKSMWESIGKLIKLFHKHGLYHADLNANNILVTDEQQLYLIDFDKSYFRMKSEVWMQKMLTRLKRSFVKLKNEKQELNFSDKNWTSLIEGYSGQSLTRSSAQGSKY